MCVENKDDGLNIMWRGGAREGRSGTDRERERDDWSLLGIMENSEEIRSVVVGLLAMKNGSSSSPLPLQSAICLLYNASCHTL